MGMRGFTLESLPPRLRAQAEAQLARSPSLFRSPTSAPPPPKQPESPAAPSEDGKNKQKKPRKKKRIMYVKSVPCEASSLSDGGARFVLRVNPEDIPTSQQKGIDFVHGIVYTKSEIRHCEKIVTSALAPHAALTAPFRSARLAVAATFYLPFPKSVPASRRTGGAYAVGRADADNMWKGLGDSFTRAGMWDDDRQIVDLHLAKRYTSTDPRMEVYVSPASDPMPLFPDDAEEGSAEA